jgi:hypothetical protein
MQNIKKQNPIYIIIFILQIPSARAAGASKPTKRNLDETTN